MSLDARAPAAAGFGLPARAEPSRRQGRLVRALCIGLLLAFSQIWIIVLLGPDADPESSGFIRTVYLPFYGLAAGLLAAQPGRSAQALLRNPLILALLAVAFCSTIWSIDPGVTERRAVAALFTTLAGFAIGSRYDWPELADTLATGYAVLVVASFISGLLVPSYGRMSDIFPGSWRGVYYDKNGLGDGMALGFLVFAGAAALNPERRRRWIVFAGLALLLILFSTSKTSLVALALGLGVFTGVATARRGPAAAVAVAFLSVVALGALAGLIVFDSDTLLGLLGKDATLTGRTKIWTAILRQIHQRPWTGFGYGAVWTDESGWGPLAWIVKEAGFRPHHAHDSWLEVWLGMGLVGLSVWGALFASTIGRAVMAIFRGPGAYLALPFMVVYGVVSLTESVTLVHNDYIWVLFTAVAVRLALPPEPPKGARDRIGAAQAA